MVELVEKVVEVGGVGLVTLEGGSGRALLMLHDELGFRTGCAGGRPSDYYAAAALVRAHAAGGLVRLGAGHHSFG